VKGGIQPNRKMPPDEEVLAVMLEQPNAGNKELAEMWGVSRERVRTKREQLGLPPLKEQRIANRLMAKARQEEFGTQTCIICHNPMKRERIDRGWMTCSSRCSKRWRRLPGPIRKQRRSAYLAGKYEHNR